MSVDNNQKVPDSDTEWEYPYNQVTQTAGGHEVHFNSTPDKESHRLFHPGGTYTETSTNGKHVSLTSDKHYQYVSQGSSYATEGAHDHHSQGGSRHNDEQGHHSENTGDKSGGLSGALAEVIKNFIYHHSVGKKEEVVEGGHVKDVNDGDQHDNALGDKIHFIGGTKYEQVSGEHGTHVPNGNMDIQIDQGKFRLSSGNDLLITSATKITLAVGSSTIVITPNDITITSAGTVNIEAQGDIITKGATTKTQGGGRTAPPTTFS